MAEVVTEGSTMWGGLGWRREAYRAGPAEGGSGLAKGKKGLCHMELEERFGWGITF